MKFDIPTESKIKKITVSGEKSSSKGPPLPPSYDFNKTRVKLAK